MTSKILKSNYRAIVDRIRVPLKASMVFRGFYKSWRERFPVPTLTEEQALGVKAHLEQKGIL